MDEQHRDILLTHRIKFAHLVDAKLLIPSLQKSVLTDKEVDEVLRESTAPARAEKLLDLLPAKGNHAFQSLCVSLESTYPHLLTMMFLGMNKVPDPKLAPLTSDSELDEPTCADSDQGQFGADIISMHHDKYGSQKSSRLYVVPNPQSSFAHSYDPQSDIAMLKSDMKLVALDRDPARMDSHKQVESQGRRLVASTGVSSSDKTLSSRRDYERLKMQCDSAMRELQALRRQHGDTVRKCDTAMKESDYYRMQHKLVANKLDQHQSDTMALRSQYNEVLADKHRLDQEVVNLQKFCEEDRKEVTELRRQQQEAMNDSGNSETINQMYIAAVRKHEAIKDDYDSLRKLYADLIASHSAASGKLELTQEEVVRLKKQSEDIIQERNAAIRERNGLKQQCTEAIRQWDTALRERNEAKEALIKVQQQRDEAMKDINQAMAVRLKASKDLARLTEERNAAVQEYSLIMSERDSVHKEIEKLQEELSESSKKTKCLETQKKVSFEEVETLQREIASALHDRDRAIKQCHELREKYGDYDTSLGDGLTTSEEQPKDYEYYHRTRNTSLQNRPEMLLDHAGNGGDTFGKTKKERVDNLDQANQEIDRLRKQVEKLQTELTEASQEVEVSKRRRDWAFSERDKIVQERESIRTLCDKLRRERDRAVSDLAEALRDSDDVKKQRNEASKELKELREKIESQLEKESRMKHLHSLGHNHSRDSAIDADLQEWETETLEFDIGAANEDEVGFELSGGKDDPQFPDSPIYVCNVIKGSAADGKLRVNDCVVLVNNADLTNAPRATAFEAVRSSAGIINMVVRRRRLTSSRFIQSVHLNLSGNKEHGLCLETGVYVNKIAPGSVAAKEGNLALGDRVISVNGRSLDGFRFGLEAMKLLDLSGDNLVLSLLKCVNPPSAPLSSSSSGHNIQDNDADKHSCSPKSYSAVNRSPMRDGSLLRGANNSKEPVKKLTTSSSQTEEVMPVVNSLLTCSPGHHKLSNGQADGDTGLADDQKSSCEHSNGNCQQPPPPPPQTFLDKFFGDRRSTKEHKTKHKAFVWAASTPLQEEEAIAELDSVIDYCKKSCAPNKSSGSGTSKSRKKRTSDKANAEKSLGTWPKYRGPPLEYLETVPGTMTQSRRKRERVSIASLLNAPKLPAAMLYENKQERGERLRERREREIERERGGAGSGGGSSRDAENGADGRSSVSRRSSAGLGGGGGGGSSVSERERAFAAQSAATAAALNSLPPGVLQSMKASGHFVSNPKCGYPQTSLMSSGKSAVTGSGSSLDYSVVSANRDKELLEYYKSKARPKSAMYLPSERERFSSPDGSCSTPAKPSSLDIHSLYKPLPSLGHLSRGDLSPSDHHLIGSPRLSERELSLLNHARATPPSAVSYASGHPSVNDHFPTYYTVSQGRIAHNNHHMASGGGGSSNGGNGSVVYAQHTTGLTSASSSSSAGVGSPSPRYSSPPYMSRSGESLLEGAFHPTSLPPTLDGRAYNQHHHNHHHQQQHHRYVVNPSPSPSPQHYPGYGHSPSHSMDLPNFLPVAVAAASSKRASSGSGAIAVIPAFRGNAGELSGFGSYDGPSGGATKRPPYRIRIPSNQSVTSKSSAGTKVSTSSIERASISDRGSPMPAFRVETITPGGTITPRSVADYQNKKPSHGELRNIRIDKTAEETLGIQIDCGTRGGIFVSQVTENSLASQAGIHIGDQLLEVCGINLRSATYLLAANVLRQCGDSITMLVQYNHEKCREMLGIGGSSSSEGSPVQTPTPRSSPKSRSPPQLDMDDSLPASATSTLKRQNTLVGQVTRSSNAKEAQIGGDMYAPRYVFLKMATSDLGITFLGGNAVGIFVHKVQIDSPASGTNGLRCGDQILEYNGIDLRHATAEQAAYELAKRAETVTILSQFNIDRYNEIQHLPGDSFYIRAMFDHQAENQNELSFRKDDILYVDNTMFNGVSGLWRAWVVDEDGHRKQCGVIPSKYKVEEELLLKRSLGELDSDSGSRRSAITTVSARRSFFRRNRKHQRSNSRDSKELASFSDISINSFSDSGTLIEDPAILTYQRVERLNDLMLRPVLLLGPLIDTVVDKLVQDFPRKFVRCVPEVMNASAQSMEEGLMENIYIDYRRRGSHFECLTLNTITTMCDEVRPYNCHCIVDVSPAAVERLHRNQIYPVVLFIKFKSTKQIREVKDPRLCSEKVTTKAAKEMYEHSLRLESEYKHLISATIPGGNLAYMCSQIEAQVEQEQNKVLWVPAGNI